MDKPLEDRRIVRSDGISKLTGLASATIYEAVGDRGSPPPVERRGERVCAGHPRGRGQRTDDLPQDQCLP